MDTLTSLSYLTSAVLFILSIRGLSSPETARQGITLGIVGMALAIVTTLFNPLVEGWLLPILGIAIGGTIGTIMAKRVDFRDLPQLVALFNALVGLASVFIGIAAFFNPEAYGIGSIGAIQLNSLVEMSLGASIGAVTFTGSIIAFGKLQGVITGKPVTFPMQHKINAGLGALLVILILTFCVTQDTFTLLAIVGIAFALGILLIIPIGGADMPVIVSMLNSYSGWAAAGIGFTLANTLLIITGGTCRGIGCDFILHHV